MDMAMNSFRAHGDRDTVEDAVSLAARQWEELGQFSNLLDIFIDSAREALDDHGIPPPQH